MKKDIPKSKTPKTIALLRLLEAEEYLLLKEKLVNQKKLRLLILLEHLWLLLNKEYNETIKSEIFSKLFSEQYTEKKDYLLRNEFRNLNKQIEQFLVNKEIKEEVKNNINAFNYYLLRVLQDRKALDLFKLEYKDAYDDAIENADYYAAHNITGLNFVNYTQFLNLKEKDIKYINQLNDLKLTHLSCYYLTAFRNHQINSEYTRSFFYPFSINEIEPIKKVKVDFNQFENDYSGYLYLKAKCFLVPHQERIELLHKCLEFVKKQPTDSLIFKTELKFCLANLANTYSLVADIKKTNKYFEEFFAIKAEKDDPYILSVMCDFITELIKQKDFDNAIQHIAENRIEINKIEKLNTRLLCLEIASYAYANKPVELYNLLPQSFGNYNKLLKFFFRFYYSIFSYLKNNIEDSYNETSNMKNSISKNDTGFDIRPIFNFFNRFYYILISYSENIAKRDHYLNKLLDDIVDYSKSALPEYKSYLPFLWLKDEIVILLDVK